MKRSASRETLTTTSKVPQPEPKKFSTNIFDPRLNRLGTKFNLADHVVSPGGHRQAIFRDSFNVNPRSRSSDHRIASGARRFEKLNFNLSTINSSSSRDDTSSDQEVVLDRVVSPPLNDVQQQTTANLANDVDVVDDNEDAISDVSDVSSVHSSDISEISDVECEDSTDDSIGSEGSDSDSGTKLLKF